MTKWVTKKLGDEDVVDFIKGEQINGDLLQKEGSYPMFNGGFEPSGYLEFYNTEANEVIISEGGNSCGYINFVKSKFWRGGHCYLVKFKKDNTFNKSFFYYLLKLNEENIMKLRVGSGLPNIQKKDLNRYEISFPESLAEQRRIAAILSSADKVIATSEALIEKYKHIKQGMLTDLLQPKEGWKKVKLGECCEVNPHNTTNLPENFFYIDLESVISGKLIKGQFVSKKEAPSRAQRLVINDDILYQTVRPYQKNNYHFIGDDNQYVASTGYALLRVKSNIDADFIYHIVHTHEFVSKVLGLCTGTSYPAITPSLLNIIEISVPFKDGQPDLTEQRRIASILSSIDAKILAEEKVVEKYKGVKKGLMERMMGRKKLKK